MLGIGNLVFHATIISLKRFEIGYISPKIPVVSLFKMSKSLKQLFSEVFKSKVLPLQEITRFK